jgi:hypothetical protein
MRRPRAAVVGAAVEIAALPEACRGCADDASRMTASFAPTLAVTPSATSISASTPAACAGISVLTLSVSTSEKHVVRLDRVADLLVPLRDRALGDGLAELRHDYIHSQATFPLSQSISYFSHLDSGHIKDERGGMKDDPALCVASHRPDGSERPGH